MTEIKLRSYFNPSDPTTYGGPTMDFLMKDYGALDESEQLATAIRVALGTDRLADMQEVLPDPDSSDRKGWWGDLDAEAIWGGWPIGTRAWLLSRAKILDIPSAEGSTLLRAEQYTREALQPFIDRRIATYVTVQARRTDLERIEVEVVMYRGPEDEINLRYQYLWDEIVNPPVDWYPIEIRISRRVFKTDLRLSPTPPSVYVTGPMSLVTWFSGMVLSTSAPTVDQTGIHPHTRSPLWRNLMLTSVAPTIVHTGPKLLEPVWRPINISSVRPTVTIGVI